MFCSKFHTLSSGAKILKIGLDLTELRKVHSKVGTFFETQCSSSRVTTGEGEASVLTS